MNLLGHLGFAVLKRRYRHGFPELPGDPKQTARLIGACGESYAYWYLRHLGYVFIARNYMNDHNKGEIDLVAFDRSCLVFIEVRTRAPSDHKDSLPELSISRAKHQVLIRTAHYFLRERQLPPDCPVRFDVVAIDHSPHQPPVLRLHKDALSPSLKDRFAT